MSDVVVVVVVAVIEERDYGAPASTYPRGRVPEGLVRKVRRVGGWDLCISLKNHRIIDYTRMCATLIPAGLGSHRFGKRFEGVWEVCHSANIGDKR